MAPQWEGRSNTKCRSLAPGARLHGTWPSLAASVKLSPLASGADANHQQESGHHPQAIRERCGLLTHTDSSQTSRGHEAVRSLVLTPGDSESADQL
jgi:hypothetical protein